VQRQADPEANLGRGEGAGMRHRLIVGARSAGLRLALLLLFLAPCAHASDDESPADETTRLVGIAEALSHTVLALPESVPPTWAGDLSTRSQLSGDWFGVRDDLAAAGVTFLGDITQYYQGVTTGGLAQRFEYGGRGDYLLDLDFGKLGLWEGGYLDLRAETRLGQDCNRIDGNVAPSNFAMALPLPNRNVTALTGVQFTQDLSDNLSVFFGKLNLLDGTPSTYALGRRLNSFWNAGLQNNLTRIYLLPSTLGAGVRISDQQEPVFNFYVLDSHYTPTTSGFQSLFNNGVVLYGEYQVRTNWFDLSGHSSFGCLYSDAERVPLKSNPFVVLPPLPPRVRPVPRSNAWTVTYHCDQVLYADPNDPKRNWILNSDLGLTDGDPNPIKWFANVALVGTGPLRSRANDTLGIGYYHLGLSNLPILKFLGFGPENGVELFYNIAITPWCHLTPDIQIVDPSNIHHAADILVGLRLRISF
jgi:porin